MKVKNKPKEHNTTLNFYKPSSAELSGISPALHESSSSKAVQRKNSKMQIPKEYMQVMIA